MHSIDLDTCNSILDLYKTHFLTKSLFNSLRKKTLVFQSVSSFTYFICDGKWFIRRTPLRYVYSEGEQCGGEALQLQKPNPKDTSEVLHTTLPISCDPQNSVDVA